MRRTSSSTLHGVDAFVVTSVAVLGVAVGAVLDPVGQRLADASRDAEERRRADREARRVAEARAADDPGPGVTAGSLPDGTTAPRGPAPVPELRPTPLGDATDTAPGAVRHLLAAGPSVPRTVGAALVTGGLFALAASRYTGSGRVEAPWVVAPLCVFLAMAVVVSVTDLTHRLVPRQLLYGALALIVPLYVILSAHAHHWRPLADAAVAGAAAFAVFFVIWFVVPRGMGFGDVRLAGVIGVSVGYLDLLHAYLAFLIGFVVGLVFGLVLMVGSSSGRRTRIPFAPALCVGAAVAILWGDPLVHHVFHAQG